MLSLKAGGTGLNLTAASHVVLYDRWWNPAVEDQARDRAWRIGQTRTVVCHRLVCPGTVDERVEEVVAGKRRIADLVLPKSSSLADLDAGQLRVALGIRPDSVLTEESRASWPPTPAPESPDERAPPPHAGASQPASPPGAATATSGAPPTSTDDAIDVITPADDPTTMLRSLGPAPFPGGDTVAEHYFAAVYQKASAMAIALAAASDLLPDAEPDDVDRAEFAPTRQVTHASKSCRRPARSRRSRRSGERRRARSPVRRARRRRSHAPAARRPTGRSCRPPLRLVEGEELEAEAGHPFEEAPRLFGDLDDPLPIEPVVVLERDEHPDHGRLLSAPSRAPSRSPRLTGSG